MTIEELKVLINKRIDELHKAMSIDYGDFDNTTYHFICGKVDAYQTVLEWIEYGETGMPKDFDISDTLEEL